MKRKGKERKGKERKGKDYAFRRQFHEKPSIIPGCPEAIWKPCNLLPHRHDECAALVAHAKFALGERAQCPRVRHQKFASQTGLESVMPTWAVNPQDHSFDLGVKPGFLQLLTQLAAANLLLLAQAWCTCARHNDTCTTWPHHTPAQLATQYQHDAGKPVRVDTFAQTDTSVRAHSCAAGSVSHFSMHFTLTNCLRFRPRCGACTVLCPRASSHS